ncbi:MAG: hypothetical protein CL610_20430 [Anaerolineaceae bacterium]|nr:hypothetical protein [Anaerolineaceae bacterium]
MIESETAMPVDIYPAEQPATLTVYCRDIITVEDARYILDQCRAAVRSHPIHFLIDCTEMRNLAPGVLNVLTSYGEFLRHPNTGILACVTQSALLRFSMEVLFGHSAFRFFEDRETADQFLADAGN